MRSSENDYCVPHYGWSLRIYTYGDLCTLSSINEEYKYSKRDESITGKDVDQLALNRGQEQSRRYVANKGGDVHAGDRASEKVWALPEIFEKILLDISAREVLLNQRVCRQWKAVIEWSTPLQQALFKKPIGPMLHYGNVPMNEGDIDQYELECQGTLEGIVPFEHPIVSMILGGYRTAKVKEKHVHGVRGQLLTQPPLAECNVAVTRRRTFALEAGCHGILAFDLLSEVVDWEAGMTDGGDVQGVCGWRSVVRSWRDEPVWSLLEELSWELNNQSK